MAVVRSLAIVDDAELLDRWRAGDADAGKDLFARYFQPLYRFFASKCAAPDDLVQQTFFAIVRARDQFGGRSTFRTYLYTVARHELYRHLRGLARTRAFDPELSSIAELVSSAGTKLARRQEHERLRAALRTLPVEQQTLLELHYWDGLDAAGLAEIFESNPAAIRNRLHRARTSLREALAALDGVPVTSVGSDEEVESLARSAG